ncbi:hypothetical protein BDC45DRAFT_560482 [Circinella umbellata]|nr:hypothetical protein BDC45DRAFT_560482 [Circinella umbellata]
MIKLVLVKVIYLYKYDTSPPKLTLTRILRIRSSSTLLQALLVLYEKKQLKSIVQKGEYQTLSDLHGQTLSGTVCTMMDLSLTLSFSLSFLAYTSLIFAVGCLIIGQTNKWYVGVLISGMLRLKPQKEKS